MPDNVTNELMFETLKAMQAQLLAISNDIAEIKADNRAHRSITTGPVNAADPVPGRIADMQASQ